MPIWMLYVLDVLIVAVVLLGFVEYLRWKFNQTTKGKIVLEEWLESGSRLRTLQQSTPVGKVNKIEVVRNKRKLQYIYTKEAVGNTRYPEGMPFRFLQIAVPIVSFYEGCAEPINPYIIKALAGHKKHLVTIKELATPTMLGALADEELLGILTAASQEIQHLEQELIKALLAKVNKWVVYIGLVLAIGTGIGAIYIGVQNMNLIQYLVDKGG